MTTLANSTVKLIQEFEGCKLQAYQLKGDKPTIGYGHTGSDVHMGMKITQQQAEMYLFGDLKERANFLNSHIHRELTQNQFDALMSFLYNRGSGNFLKSRLYKLVNAGDMVGAANAFLDKENWNFSKFNANIRNSLYNRRRREREVFITK